MSTIIATFSESVRNNAALRVPGNYVISGGPTSPTVSAVIRLDRYRVQLTMNTVKNGGTYTMTISNITTYRNKPLEAPFNQMTFTGTAALPRLLSATEQAGGHTIRLVFNKVMKKTAVETASNYEITGDTTLTPASASQVNDTTVDVTTTEEMLQGGSYVFFCKPGILDEGDNAIDSNYDTDPVTGIGVKPQMSASAAIGATQVEVEFNENMQDAGMLGAGNYTFSGPGAPISADTVAKNTQKKVTITITGVMTEGETYTVQGNTTNLKDTTGNTLDPANKSKTFAGVGVFPKVTGAVRTAADQVTVTFDSNMRDAELTTHGNYGITGDSAISVSEVTKSDAKNVIVTFTGEMKTGTANYTVDVTGVYSTEGNLLDEANDTATFNGLGVAPRMSADVTWISNTHLHATFNETMATASVEDVSHWSVGGSAPDSVSLSGGVTAGLTMASDVTPGVVTVTCTDHVTDAVGNPVEAGYRSGTCRAFKFENMDPDWSAAWHTNFAAYDSVDEEIIMIEHHDTKSPVYYWDGSGDWQYDTPSTNIGAHLEGMTGCQGPDGRVIAYGGYKQDIMLMLDKTWKWNGTDWVDMNPAAYPSARRYCIAAYDSTRGRLVMFGGDDGAGTDYDDTWEWNGTTWTEYASGAVTKPPAMTRGTVGNWGSMAFDANRGVCVLVNGNIDPTKVWEWNGSTWTEKTVTAPGIGTSARLHYDPHAKLIIALINSLIPEGNYTAVWTWNGTAWAEYHDVCGTYDPALWPYYANINESIYFPPDDRILIYCHTAEETYYL